MNIRPVAYPAHAKPRPADHYPDSFDICKFITLPQAGIATADNGLVGMDQKIELI
jgi:hypothetical protein